MAISRFWNGEASRLEALLVSVCGSLGAFALLLGIQVAMRVPKNPAAAPATVWAAHLVFTWILALWLAFLATGLLRKASARKGAHRLLPASLGLLALTLPVLELLAEWR